MANRKISDLTALTAPATGDLLPIVDISEAAAADKNKKITYGELLASAPDGSAAAPSFSFDSDPNSGLYSAGADQVAISTNGTGRVFVDSSGNVGIGTTSPGTALEVNGAAKANYAIASGGLSAFASSSGGLYTYFTSGASIIQSVSDNSGTAAPLLFVSGTERMRIDSSGRLLVGTSTARSTFGNEGISSIFQVEGLSNNIARYVSQVYNSNDGGSAVHIFGKSRGTTLGSVTVVQSDDALAELRFEGADGTDFVTSASIRCHVDGTPGANDMPGRLVFSTTADGASSPTERMRIKSTGIINFSNAPTYADNTAATAAGLAVGDVYKTALGVLMIRF